MGKMGGFPGGLGNMQQIMKQAQRMQADMQKKQEEVASTEFEVSVGGGAVKLKASGDKKIKEIIISKDVVDPEDVEMLQDLILTAVNEAISKADSMMSDSMGGFNIPGLM